MHLKMSSNRIIIVNCNDERSNKDKSFIGISCLYGYKEAELKGFVVV